MKAVVTGAGGFVGSHLVRRLAADGTSVVAIVRPGSSLWRLEDVLGSITVVEADLLRDSGASALRHAGHVDVLFHLAAAGVDPTRGDDPTLVEDNVRLAFHALELAAELGVERLVNAGSCFEYPAGDRIGEQVPPAPRSWYAAGKSAAWIVLHAHQRRTGLPTLTLRPFTTYGPYESPYRLVSSTTLSALAGRPIKLTSGEQRRDFVHVHDAVDAFVTAATKGNDGATYNVCTGVATRVVDVARTVVRLSGGDSVLDVGAIPTRSIEFASLSGDPAAASRELGWQATLTLEHGLGQTVEWFRERGVGLPEYGMVAA